MAYRKYENNRTGFLGSHHLSSAPHWWRKRRRSAQRQGVHFRLQDRAPWEDEASPWPPRASQFSRLAGAQQRPVLSPACSLLSPTGHTRYHWHTHTHTHRYTNTYTHKCVHYLRTCMRPPPTHTHTFNIVGPHSCHCAWRFISDTEATSIGAVLSKDCTLYTDRHTHTHTLPHTHTHTPSHTQTQTWFGDSIHISTHIFMSILYAFELTCVQR